MGTRKNRLYGGRIRKAYLHPRSGHLLVDLYRDNVRSKQYVHQLVAAAFIGPCPEGQEVRHWDGDPSNNAASNLLYGTHAENMQDMVRHGRNFNRNRGKTHCDHGHEFTPGNTWTDKRGSRYCRACSRIRQTPNPKPKDDHCPNGHERTEANIYVRANGARCCRICIADAGKRWRDRKAAS